MKDEKSQIDKLLKLKELYESGVLSKEEMESEKRKILESSDQQHQNKSTTVSPKTLIWIIAGILLCGCIVGGVLLLKNKSIEETTIEQGDAGFPNEEKARQVIGDYLNAIVNNDFATLASIYAPNVDRFQSLYDADKEKVIDCHRRYDDKFKVIAKHSDVRWETFRMEQLNNGNISVVVVEDYSIDRKDKTAQSVFVLEKHFELDPNYQVISVYDIQQSSEGNVYANKTNDELAKEVVKIFKKVLDGHMDDGSRVSNEVYFPNYPAFDQLIKNIVSSKYDYKDMVKCGIVSSNWVTMAMGKYNVFEVQAFYELLEYTLVFDSYFDEEFHVKIELTNSSSETVKYEWYSKHWGED